MGVSADGQPPTPEHRLRRTLKGTGRRRREKGASFEKVNGYQNTSPSSVNRTSQGHGPKQPERGVRRWQKTSGKLRFLKIGNFSGPVKPPEEAQCGFACGMWTACCQNAHGRGPAEMHVHGTFSFFFFNVQKNEVTV